jgi:hypothetical protein
MGWNIDVRGFINLPVDSNVESRLRITVVDEERGSATQKHSKTDRNGVKKFWSVKVQIMHLGNYASHHMNKMATLDNNTALEKACTPQSWDTIHMSVKDQRLCFLCINPYYEKLCTITLSFGSYNASNQPLS